MAGIFGNQPMPLIPRVISADTTLTGNDFVSSYNTIVQTGSDTWTVTLPAATKGLTLRPTHLVNASSGAFTFACSSGFVGGGSSFVLDAGNSAWLRAVPTDGTGQTWKWAILGAAQAITGLLETIQDVVGGMVSGNTETNVAVTYDDSTGKLNFVVSGMTVATTDISDWSDGFLSELQTVLAASTTLGATWTDEDLSIDSIQYKCTALTGGAAGALDAIDGDDLTVDGQIALVEVSGVAYLYKLNLTGGQAESSPEIIVPDANAGTINWELIKPYVLAANVTNFDTAAVSATASEYAATDDVRLPEDWDAWTPSGVVWSGGAPASVTEVYRYRTVNDTVDFKVSILTADGDAKTLTSIALPTTPADIGCKVRCTCCQTVDGTETDGFAWIDTSGDGLLKFDGATEWTDGTACSIEVSGSYEV